MAGRVSLHPSPGLSPGTTRSLMAQLAFCCPAPPPCDVLEQEGSRAGPGSSQWVKMGRGMGRKYSHGDEGVFLRPVTIPETLMHSGPISM